MSEPTHCPLVIDPTASGDRKSRAAAPDLITDLDEIAGREAENGLRQFDAVIALIEQARAENRPFRLRLSTIYGLHRLALEGISGFAGKSRPSTVSIEGSAHTPPAAHLVDSLVEDLCEYVNSNWETANALHLAAYVLWRLNWIHPFDDGNGRTSRAISYLVLCMKYGDRIAGLKTIPELISENKQPYYIAIEHADAAEKEGRLDVSAVEKLLEDLLAKQLVSVLESVKGRSIV